MPGRVDIRDERGGIFVLTALVLPMLLILTTFAIDVSNFFMHKRHLQTQADAAALAGGSQLQVGAGCDGAALAESLKYSGAPGAAHNVPRNPADAARLTLVQNEPLPCAAGAVDVSVRENDVPWLFPVLALADVDIQADARVELQQLAANTNSLPVAVQEDKKVKRVTATLFDETKTPSTDPKAQTKVLATAGGDAATTRYATAAGDLFTRTVTEAALGFRVTVEYTDGTSRTYDAGSADGLLHVHGFEQVAPVVSEAPPALEDVTMTTEGCPADDTAGLATAGCTLRVRARVDFVDTVNLASHAFLATTLGGVRKAMTRVGTTDIFETTYVLAGTGPQPLTIDWRQEAGKVSPTQRCDTGAGKKDNPCYGVFKGDRAAGVYTGGTAGSLTGATPVHRAFVKHADRSGDVVSARATELGGLLASVEKGSTHAWTLEVGLPSELELGARRVLTLKSPGANGGHLDCDPMNLAGTTGGGAQVFQAQLANGCEPMYKINKGEPCPTRQTDFSASLPQPWSCVLSSPGEQTGSLGPGLNTRVYGSATRVSPAVCTSNRNRYPNWSPDDKRIVSVMLVKNGQLADGGRDVFPVKDFAYFYLVDWHDGNNPACPNDDVTPSDVAGPGEMVGHFIKYARPGDGGGYGTTDCDASSLGGCVPVMTK